MQWYKEGYQAFIDGILKIENNPYLNDIMDTRAENWNQGYKEAMIDKEYYIFQA